MNGITDPGQWNTPYSCVVTSYRTMKKEARDEYDAAYDKFIRPMKIKKKSLLEAILRATGVPKERMREK